LPWSCFAPFPYWLSKPAGHPVRPGATITIDDKEVASKQMQRTLPMIVQWDESFDIGSDTLTGVNDADYKPPFS
jgi:hypothetical protein